MATLRNVLGKDYGTTLYEWYIYSFGTKKFVKITQEVSKVLGIDIWEAVKDELWSKGLCGERGQARMGKGMRGRIKEVLKTLDIQAWGIKIKNSSMKVRQIEGKTKLIEAGRLMGYLLIEEEYGVVMIQRSMGFVVTAGEGWVYVYTIKNKLNDWVKKGTLGMGLKCTQIGYFNLAATDIAMKLQKAMDGHMVFRAQRHGTRRAQFLKRRVNRNTQANKKRETHTNV